MNRGVFSLASLATVSPLVGFMGTIFSIFASIRGVAGDRRTVAMAMVHDLSQSLAPTALGLVISVLAFVAYRYFSDRLELLDAEMKNASLELLNQLSRLT